LLVPLRLKSLVLSVAPSVGELIATEVGVVHVLPPPPPPPPEDVTFTVDGGVELPEQPLESLTTAV